VGEIRDSTVKDSGESFLSVCAAEAEGVLNGSDEKTGGLLTGFQCYDDLYGGLWPGQLIIIAGRPGQGKSALAMCLGKNVLDQGKGAALFSLEMDRHELAKRFASVYTQIPFSQLRDRYIYRQDGAEILGDFINRIATKNFHVEDKANISVGELTAKARHYRKKRGVNLIIVDYLQLLSEPGFHTKNDEISYITRQMKLLARELEVPVVLLSQLNRTVESRESKRPQLSDLRDSGSIEQDADAVIMIFREDYYRKYEPGYQQNNTAKLIIAKMRNGEPGEIELSWTGETMTFENKKDSR